MRIEREGWAATRREEPFSVVPALDETDSDDGSSDSPLVVMEKNT